MGFPFIIIIMLAGQLTLSIYGCICLPFDYKTLQYYYYYCLLHSSKNISAVSLSGILRFNWDFWKTENLDFPCNFILIEDYCLLRGFLPGNTVRVKYVQIKKEMKKKNQMEKLYTNTVLSFVGIIIWNGFDFCLLLYKIGFFFSYLR